MCEFFGGKFHERIKNRDSVIEKAIQYDLAHYHEKTGEIVWDNATLEEIYIGEE